MEEAVVEEVIIFKSFFLEYILFFQSEFCAIPQKSYKQVF